MGVVEAGVKMWCLTLAFLSSGSWWPISSNCVSFRSAGASWSHPRCSYNPSAMFCWDLPGKRLCKSSSLSFNILLFPVLRWDRIWASSTVVCPQPFLLWCSESLCLPPPPFLYVFFGLPIGLLPSASVSRGIGVHNTYSGVGNSLYQNYNLKWR